MKTSKELKKKLNLTFWYKQPKEYQLWSYLKQLHFHYLVSTSTYRRRDPLRCGCHFFIVWTASWHTTASLIRTKCIRIDVVAEKRKQSTDTFTFALVKHLTLTAVGNRFLERFLRRLRLWILRRWICFGLWRLLVDLTQNRERNEMC